MPFNLSLFIQLRIAMCSAWHSVTWFLGLLFSAFHSPAELYSSVSGCLWSCSRRSSPVCVVFVTQQTVKTKFGNSDTRCWLKDWKSKSINSSGYVWSSVCLFLFSPLKYPPLNDRRWGKLSGTWHWTGFNNLLKIPKQARKKSMI